LLGGGGTGLRLFLRPSRGAKKAKRGEKGKKKNAFHREKGTRTMSRVGARPVVTCPEKTRQPTRQEKKRKFREEKRDKAGGEGNVRKEGRRLGRY